MVLDAHVLRAFAREKLAGNWRTAVFVSFIATVLGANGGYQIKIEAEKTITFLKQMFTPQVASIILALLLGMMFWFIAAFNYSMTFYIMAEHPDTGIMEALHESKRMMYGYRLELFIPEISKNGA